MSFCINLPNISNDKKFPNITLLCWSFSQAKTYKLNFSIIISSFYLNLELPQFLLHLLFPNLILFEQYLLKN